MNGLLGEYPLSNEVLSKSRMGLWALELDEGQEPRMYVDDVMMSLIGLKDRVSPEETYYAWHDCVELSSLPLVNSAVEKMSAGLVAEVQYPWHHPDGHTVIVRCGGVRNPAYTDGIRIEGCHQDITGILSYTSELAGQRKRMERDYQTIRGLANEYDVLHLLNLDTDEFTPFYIENENYVDPGYFVAGQGDFYSALRSSIEVGVHPDYKEKMLRYTFKDNLKEILRNKQRHAERILVKDFLGNYIWNDFVLTKIGSVEEEASRIAIGYINVNDEMEALISERNRIEEIERKIEQEHRAKEAESERYNFLINVAHEIKTPLTLILGPMEKLQREESLTEKGDKIVTRVCQQANRMKVLLDTMLASNQIEDGSEKLCFAPVLFNDWIIRATDDLHKEAENRNMPLAYDLDRTIDKIDIDERLCSIVLSNVIINAIRNNEPGNSILLSTRYSEDGSRVRVSIKDRGTCIGKADTAMLLERYYKATVDKSGFGIGMFYSKQIVEAHNGTVGAYKNTDGKGSTFWFEIPVNQAQYRI